MTFTPKQSEVVFANYSGDSNYEAAFGGGFFITVTIPDFSVSASSAPLVITAGQTGTTTITITPATNYTSTVQLSCPQNSLAAGVTCSISPASVTLSNGVPATATLTITTLAPSSATSAVTVPGNWHAPGTISFDREVWWTLSLLAGLAALLLIVLPGKRRSLRASTFGCACLLSFAIGCGGGASGNGGGGGGGGGGSVPTTTVLSVQSTKVTQMAGLTLTATVDSSRPVTGSIRLTSANCNVSLDYQLQTGTQQVFNPGFLPVGICTFVANYEGDPNNFPSQSGSLNVALTGTVNMQVSASTSVVSHPVSLGVTIQ